MTGFTYVLARPSFSADEGLPTNHVCTGGGRARGSARKQLWDTVMTNFAACSSRWKDRKVVCGTVEKIISNLLRQSFLLIITAKRGQENPEYEQVLRL